MRKAETKQENQTLIKSNHLFGSLAYAFYLAWLFVINGSSLFDQSMQPEIDTVTLWPLSRLVLFTGISFVLIFPRLTNSISSKRARLFLTLFSISPCFFILSRYLPGYYSLTAWFVVGVCYGLTMALWPVLFIRLNHKQIKSFFLVCTIEAFVFCLVLIGLKDFLTPVVTGLFPLASSVMLLLSMSGTTNIDTTTIPRPSDSKIPKYSFFSVFASRTAMSYLALTCLYLSISKGAFGYILLTVLLAIAFCIILYLDYRFLHVFDESRVIKLYLAIAVFLIIPSGVTGWQPFSIILACAALALLLTFNVQNYTSLFGHIILYGLDPIKTKEKEKIIYFGGLFVGTAIFLLSFYFPVTSTFSVYSFIVAGLLVAGHMLSGLEGYSPFKEKDFVNEETMAFGVEKTAFSKNAWTERCKCLQEMYGLTNREFEVMFLFSKGFTAEKISAKLFISHATVRAHMYNVYHKVDVHSRAELNARINEAYDNARAFRENESVQEVPKQHLGTS